jgi:hypothetical protein
MGHGDLLVTQLYVNGQATTAPYIPRVASAAGRLRSNADIVTNGSDAYDVKIQRCIIESTHSYV